MKYLRKLALYAPFLSGVLIVGCVAAALKDYEEPVYEVLAAETVEENVVSETQEPEEAVQEETEDTEQKERTLTGVLPAAVGKAAVEEQEEETGELNLSGLEDGVYKGTGTGFAGKITVSVEIKDHKIVSIEIVQVEADDASFIAQAKGVIDRILAAQSLDVDTVSGATYSSRGIIRAVRNALTGEADDGQTAGSSAGTGLGSTTLAAFKDPESYKDGVYEGSATGFAGTIKVKVTITGGKIVKIEITETVDGTEYIQNASAVLARIIEAQGTNVDTVSGATYSSVGIINAVRNALAKAAASEDNNAGKFPYEDGIYYGTAAGYKGDITVAVVLQEETIKAILITESSDDAAYLSKASAVAEEIVSKQSVKVDTVSGATYSSNGILKAVKKAIKAAKNGNTQEEEDTEDTEETGETGNFPYKEGVYYGTGTGFSGDVTVAVAIADYTIKAVIVTQTSDDAEFFDRARSIIDSVVTKQSLEVDAVTGATYSSNGILEALKNAIEAAKKATDGTADSEEQEQEPDTDTGNDDTQDAVSDGTGTDTNEPDTGDNSENSTEGTVYKNGTYNVTVLCTDDTDTVEGNFKYNLNANVTISGDKITAVENLIIVDIDYDASDNAKYVKLAAEGNAKNTGVVAQILAKGNAEGIDAVTGATYSSDAIAEACKEALRQAMEGT